MTVKYIETLPEFFDEINQTGTTVVKVSTSTCGPCKMMAPIFEKASEEEYQYNLNFIALSPEDNPEIATYVRSTLKVATVPTFIIYVDGVISSQFSGALPLSAFKARLGL